MKERVYNIILIIILIASLTLLFVQNVKAITGHATEGSTYSNVTISKYLSIDFGANLAEGIYFGIVQSLPATDINATHNYDGVSNATTYFINVSSDGNTAVDFCIKANGGLNNGAGAEIGLGNETYYGINETSTIDNPSLLNQTALAISYVKAVNQTNPGNSSYWRFWLDVPAAQETGDYNNTVSFRGVATTLDCGS